jgi:hypothetical protein
MNLLNNSYFPGSATENPIRRYLSALFHWCCDWYIAEYDGDDLFWGYANLGDDQNAEWGYISFQELKEIKVRGVIEIDNDLYWKPKKFGEIRRLKFK